MFCGKVAPIICYMINKSPSNFKVLKKAWIGRDVSYSHLIVFGFKSFMHVPKEQRFKLDDKVTPHIFVGYGDGELGLGYGI